MYGKIKEEVILKKRKRKPIYPVFEKRIFITNPDKIDVKKTKAFPEMKWKLKCRKREKKKPKRGRKRHLKMKQKLI
jgi:hypothetical protein